MCAVSRPYISQRVLTDDSPRARRALQSFAYESIAEHAAADAAQPPSTAQHALAGGGLVASGAHAARAPVLDAPPGAVLFRGAG